MKYVLEHCSWEMTRNCNMNCMHCCCGESRGDEKEALSHEKAMEVAQEIVEMGVKDVSLTGGEPFLRKDWNEIARALADGGVMVDLITNGTLINDRIIRQIQDSGISLVGVSLDGVRDTHDRIRCPGSYDACMAGVERLVLEEIPVTATTTLQKRNIGELEEMAEILQDSGVKGWLLQLAAPFGNMEKNRDLVIEPDQIEEIIDFCYRREEKDDFYIMLGDSIGYYTKKESVFRSRAIGSVEPVVWRGCPAGASTLNIAYDGDILTASLCVDKLIAGSLRERSLRDIWNDDDAFAARRKLDPKKFKGFCGTCRYVEMCLGGCLAMRYADTGDIYGENRYCAYRNAMLGASD